MRLNNIYNMRAILLVLCLLTVIVSCGKKKSVGGEEIPVKPQKSSLIYPNQNEACLSGTVITPTTSEIIFNWSVAANTAEYEINVKNLISGEVFKKVTKVSTISLTLQVNTPYQWFVISRNGVENVQSDSWKFYNAGTVITYYPPFPADKLIPSMGQVLKAVNGKITLSWEGSDADRDITGYDLYLGKTTTPLISKADLSAPKVDVEVSVGITYYWKIITKDSKGNSSDSGIYRFSVE